MSDAFIDDGVRAPSGRHARALAVALERVS